MIDRREEYDPSKLLTRAAIFLVASLIFFVGLMICFQIYKTGEANTESWAALTGLIGWVTGTVSMIYNARYGTSKAGETKDAVIAQQSRTAEAIATGTGSGSAQTATAKVDTMNVQADTANVTTGDK